MTHCTAISERALCSPSSRNLDTASIATSRSSRTESPRLFLTLVNRWKWRCSDCTGDRPSAMLCRRVAAQRSFAQVARWMTATLHRPVARRAGAKGGHRCKPALQSESAQTGLASAKLLTQQRFERQFKRSRKLRQHEVMGCALGVRCSR